MPAQRLRCLPGAQACMPCQVQRASVPCQYRGRTAYGCTGRACHASTETALLTDAPAESACQYRGRTAYGCTGCACMPVQRPHCLRVHRVCVHASAEAVLLTGCTGCTCIRAVLLATPW
eukprot:1152700-Pelagomonas_calceolata.AAC.1